MMMARQCRRLDWRRMLSEISSTEYIEWCGHFAEYPFDYLLGQYEMGQICYTNLLPHIGAENCPAPSDFYYNRPERPEQSSDDVAALAATIPGVESFT